MSRMVALMVVSMGFACADSDGPSGPSREDCEELRDHLIALALNEAGQGLTPDERAKHEANLRGSGEADVARCLKEQDKVYIECSMAAKSTAEVAACGRRK